MHKYLYLILLFISPLLITAQPSTVRAEFQKVITETPANGGTYAARGFFFDGDALSYSISDIKTDTTMLLDNRGYTYRIVYVSGAPTNLLIEFDPISASGDMASGKAQVGDPINYDLSANIFPETGSVVAKNRASNETLFREQMLDSLNSFSSQLGAITASSPLAIADQIVTADRLISGSDTYNFTLDSIPNFLISSDTTTLDFTTDLIITEIGSDSLVLGYPGVDIATVADQLFIGASPNGTVGTFMELASAFGGRYIKWANNVTNTPVVLDLGGSAPSLEFWSDAAGTNVSEVRLAGSPPNHRLEFTIDGNSTLSIYDSYMTASTEPSTPTLPTGFAIWFEDSGSNPVRMKTRQSSYGDTMTVAYLSDISSTVAAVSYDDLTSGVLTANVARVNGAASSIANPTAGEYIITVTANADIQRVDILSDNTTLNPSNELVIKIDNTANSRDRYFTAQILSLIDDAQVNYVATGTTYSQTVVGNITTITFPNMNGFGTFGSGFGYRIMLR